MKIAFDLHGVIERYPIQFKSLIGTLRNFGVKVVLMSGPPVNDILQELGDIGFHDVGHGGCWTYFNEIHSIVDFLRFDKKCTLSQDENGHWWTDDHTWWSSKSEMCRKYGVDILIDDSFQYFEHFETDHPTKFILMKDIDFSSLSKGIIQSLIGININNG